MVLVLQQTDIIADCLGVAGCSSLAYASGPLERKIQEGATAGSVESSITIPQKLSKVAVSFVSPSTEPGLVTWDAGIWTVKLFVQSSNSSIIWDTLSICRMDSNCNVIAPIATLTGINLTLNNSPVVETVTATGVVTIGQTTDRILIQLGFRNKHNKFPRTIGIIPSQNINTPIVGTLNRTFIPPVLTITPSTPISGAAYRPSTVTVSPSLPEALATIGIGLSPAVLIISPSLLVPGVAMTPATLTITPTALDAQIPTALQTLEPGVITLTPTLPIPTTLGLAGILNVFDGTQWIPIGGVGSVIEVQTSDKEVADNAIVRFDGPSGHEIQGSKIKIDDDGRLKFENQIQIGAASGDATASGSIDSLAIGAGAEALGISSVSLGSSARALGEFGVAIGRQAVAKEFGTAVGRAADASGTSSTSLGYTSRALGDTSVALGFGSATVDTATNSVAIGRFSVVFGADSMALGPITVFAASTLGIGYSKVNIEGETTSRNFISDVVTGIQPYACTSTTVNTNLNADLLDGVHVGTSGNTIGKLNTANTWSAAQTINANLIVDTDTLFVDSTNNRVGMGTAIPDELTHIAKAVDGVSVGLLVENSQANAAASTNETAEIRFGFGGINDVARISATKTEDFTVPANETSALSFYTRFNGTTNRSTRIRAGGVLELFEGTTQIQFRNDTPGGSSPSGPGILYLDSRSVVRNVLMFPGSDLVVLSNRAANGTVEIRANTATAGSGGEVTVATFEDDKITLSKELGMGTNKIINVVDPTVNQDAATKKYVDDNIPPVSVRTASITVENPTATEDLSIFFTNKAITISEIRAVLIGSATPSVTWTIRHSTDRNAVGNEVVIGGTTTTSTTTGSDVTLFNDATIPLDSFVWLETTTTSGTITELHVTLVSTED